MHILPKRCINCGRRILHPLKGKQTPDKIGWICPECYARQMWKEAVIYGDVKKW